MQVGISQAQKISQQADNDDDDEGQDEDENFKDDQ
jgi:hypothetical protein